MPETPDLTAPSLTSLPLFAAVPPPLQRPQRTDRRPPATPTPPLASTPPPPLPAVVEEGLRRGLVPTAVAAPPTTSDVDWRLVRSLRGQAADQLARILADRPDLNLEAEQERAKQMILDLLRSHDTNAGLNGRQTFSIGELSRLQKAVYDSLYGLGRLQPLVDTPGVENVSIIGFDQVFLLMQDGQIVRGPAAADSDDELIADIQFLASQSGDREFSRAVPNLDMRLKGGQRLAATAWISSRPLVSIRVHRLIDVELDDLLANGTLTPVVAAFLKAAVRAGLSIIVTGDRGSGKSVLLRALAAEWHPTEAIVTLESEFELGLDQMPWRHHQVFPLESRPGSSEKAADGTRVGAIELGELVPRSQRFPANKLIVGEVRGPEIIAMFQFLQASTGSMSTTHARTASAGVDRLVTMAMDGGSFTEEFALRQVVINIDLIVHVNFESINVLNRLEAKVQAGELNPDDAGMSRRHQRSVTDIIALELGDRSNDRRGHSEEKVFYRDREKQLRAGNIPESLRGRLEDAGFDFDTYNRMLR